MSVKMTRWSLSLVIVATLTLGIAALVVVPDSYSLPNCRCPNFWQTTMGWGMASTCAAAEQAAVADATAKAHMICSPDGVCDIDPNYTITGQCWEPSPGVKQVDIQLRFKCFLCLDEPTF